MNARIITYSLLAHINNSINSQSNFYQIFVPLVKRALSKMCAENRYKGDDTAEIIKTIDELYKIEMPPSILKILLQKVEIELNSRNVKFVEFFNDGSFVISKYTFDEYEEEIEKRTRDVNMLEDVFREFAQAEEKEVQVESLFEFLEQTKISLGKYIGKKYPKPFKDNTLEARFINFISGIPQLYELLQSVYVGSVIATYLEYQPSIQEKNVELVLDTNFIISLLDLNTPNSTSNCRKLLEIAGKLGYKFTVLDITIREFDGLMKSRRENFDNAFLSKLIDPEDIYNACERRNLTKTDLDKIRTDILIELTRFNIKVISNTDKYENKAKFSETYEQLKAKRNTSFAALHDAACIEYIKEKRGKPIYDFDKTTCWFINNSSSRGTFHSNGIQPYYIKAEELLNILWLASPMVKSMISSVEISSIGLSRLVSATLDDALPSAIIIRKLDENIQKYAKGNISDIDIVRVSKSIASRTVNQSVESLNEEAEKDPSKFVESLNNISKKEKQKEEHVRNSIRRILKNIEGKSQLLNREISKTTKDRKSFEYAADIHRNKYEEAVEVNSQLLQENKRIKNELLKIENKKREDKRREYIAMKVRNWRLKSALWIFIALCMVSLVVLYTYSINDWNGSKAKEYLLYLQQDLIVSLLFYLSSTVLGIFITFFVVRYNASTVNAFISKINIPSELKEKEEDL